MTRPEIDARVGLLVGRNTKGKRRYVSMKDLNGTGKRVPTQ